MQIIFMGPPGSGKGTQAELIKERYGIPKISTGDIVRNIATEDSAVAKEVKSIIDKGNLLPDEIVTSLVTNRLLKSDCTKGFILDGYPRTIKQAEDLDNFLLEHNLKITAVINLEVSEEELVQRITGRITCTNCGASYNKFTNKPKATDKCDKCGSHNLIIRADDNLESIKTRMLAYYNQTLPLLEYYKQRGLLKVFNGSKNLDEVTKNIILALDKMAKEENSSVVIRN